MISLPIQVRRERPNARGSADHLPIRLLTVGFHEVGLNKT